MPLLFAFVMRQTCASPWEDQAAGVLLGWGALIEKHESVPIKGVLTVGRPYWTKAGGGIGHGKFGILAI